MNVKHKLGIYAVIVLLVLCIVISCFLAVREKQNFLAFTLVFAIVAALAVFIFLQTGNFTLTKKLAMEKKELESANNDLSSAEGELERKYEELCEKNCGLKLSEERYRLAVEGVNDGIWDMVMATKNLFISNRCRSILGYDKNDLPDDYEAWVAIVHPEDREKMLKMFESYLSASKHKKPIQMELRVRTKTGDYKWVLIKGKALTNQDGAVIRITGSLTDINERKLAEEKIHQMAYFDTLTGLPNRTLLHDRFAIAAANAARKKRMLALYFLDLDNFKTVNDTLGHTYGDNLIAEVGSHLKKQMRKGDTIARLGGDEFILLQTNIKDTSEVVHMASRLLTSFKEPWMVEGREFYISASIGITIYPDDGQDIQTLMKNADTAMYRAKELGKNNFQLFTESMNRRMLEKLSLENALRKSLERGELVMHYQPQLELKTGRTVGIEALLRWNHPEYGLLYPGTFMPLAEETGMIVPIGEWVFRTACLQIKKLHDNGNDGLKMSINISARQFMQAHMLDKIAGIIEETGIDPRWLELEVTESIAMQDLDFTLVTLNKVKEMGMSIALDDFGGGYSSLNYLKKLPIDNLKMDRSFIGDMKEGTDEAKISKALITLAHDLDLKVTAEGVETVEKYRLLLNEGFDMVQGYLFSSPLPKEVLESNKALKDYIKAYENI